MKGKLFIVGGSMTKLLTIADKWITLILYGK